MSQTTFTTHLYPGFHIKLLVPLIPSSGEVATMLLYLKGSPYILQPARLLRAHGVLVINFIAT